MPSNPALPPALVGRLVADEAFRKNFLADPKPALAEHGVAADAGIMDQLKGLGEDDVNRALAAHKVGVGPY